MRESIVLVVVGVMIGFLIMAIGASATLKEYRSKAVELGAAEWVIDQKTGETTFTWKEPQP